MVVVTGAVGSGKTGLLERVIPTLEAGKSRVIRVDSPRGEQLDLRRFMQRVIDNDPVASDADPAERFYLALTRRRATETQVVLAVDDAETVTERTWNYLALIAERDPALPLQILVVGHPDLWMSLPSQGRFAADRIATLVHLGSIPGLMPLRLPELDPASVGSAPSKRPDVEPASARPSVSKRDRHTDLMPLLFPELDEHLPDGPEHAETPPMLTPAAAALPSAAASAGPPRRAWGVRAVCTAGLAAAMLVGGTGTLSRVGGPPTGAVAPARDTGAVSVAAPIHVADSAPQRTITANPPPALEAISAPSEAAAPAVVEPEAAITPLPVPVVVPQPAEPPAQPTSVMANARASVPAALSPSGAPPEVSASPASPDLVSALLARGSDLLLTGDIAAARLMFERAAAAGSGRAAIAAGMTYDPRFLAQSRIRGIVPEPRIAAAWYQRAARLGETDGTSLLADLGDAPAE